MNHFVVFADARTGTHYLESILNQHPEIRCLNETFSHIQPQHFFHFLYDELKDDPIKIIPSHWTVVFGKYLDSVYRNFKKSKQSVGMDIKYYQMDWVPGMMSVLKQKKVKAIHLIRKNYLKHNIACYLHAMRDQLGRQFHETKKVKAVTVDVDLEALIPGLEERRRTVEHYGQYIRKYLPCIDVNYEDCFDNPDMISQAIAPSVLDRIYDFLDVKKRIYDLKTTYVKSNPGTLRNLVKNYDALRDHLIKTPWRWVLDDTIGENMPDVKEMNAKAEELGKNGQVEEAKEMFLTCIRLKPDFCQPYNNLAVILYSQESFDEAKGYIQTALAISPENTLYKTNYQAINNALSEDSASETDVVTFVLVCEAWGDEEDTWLRFYVDTFQEYDRAMLIICLPVSDGKNKALVEREFVVPVLQNHEKHSTVKVIEFTNIDQIDADYVLRNRTCTDYQQVLSYRKGIIDKPDDKIFDEICSQLNRA